MRLLNRGSDGYLNKAWENIKPLKDVSMEDYLYQLFRSIYYVPEGSSEELNRIRKSHAINDIFEGLCMAYIYGKKRREDPSTLPAFKPYEILRKEEYSHIELTGSGVTNIHTLCLIVGVKKDKLKE